MISIRWGIFGAVAAIIVTIALGLLSEVNILHIFLRSLIFGVVFFGIGFGIRFVINSFLPELLYADDQSAEIEEQKAAVKEGLVIDSTGEYAVPELYKTDDQELGNIEDLISGLFRPRSEDDDRIVHEEHSTDTTMRPKGLDVIPQPVYNDLGGTTDPFGGDSFQDMSVFEKRPQEDEMELPGGTPVFTPSFGDDNGLGGLPDLDMMARAFSAAGTPSQDSDMDFGISIPAMQPMPTPPVLQSIPEAGGIPEPDRSKYTGNKAQPLEGDFDPKSIAEGIRTVLAKDDR